MKVSRSCACCSSLRCLARCSSSIFAISASEEICLRSFGCNRPLIALASIEPKLAYLFRAAAGRLRSRPHAAQVRAGVFELIVFFKEGLDLGQTLFADLAGETDLGKQSPHIVDQTRCEFTIAREHAGDCLYRA